MSLLEDRLLQILEMREQKKNYAAIAKTLRISKSTASRYEQTARQSLEKALAEGVDSLAELAEKMKMSKTVTGMAMNYFGLSISPELTPTTDNSKLTESSDSIPGPEQLINLGRLRALAGEGKTRKEIAHELGVSYDYLLKLARQEGIAITHAGIGRRSKIPFARPLKPKSSSHVALDITTALAQGERSLEKVVQHAQCGIRIFHSILKEYGITLPDDIIPYRYRPELDQGVDEGLNLDEIAARYTQETGKSITRQAVDQYLTCSAQKAYWERKKEERKKLELIPEQEERQEALQTLQALKIHLTTLVRKEGWAYEKAVESVYAQKRSTTLPQFKKILRLFQIYDDAKQEGKKWSVDELAEKSRYSLMMVSNKLQTVNVPTMCNEFYRPSRIVVAEKRKRVGALAKAASPLTAPDVEYFTGIDETSVTAYLNQLRIPSSAVSAGIKCFGSCRNSTLEQLDYRTASKLYEARDASFSDVELREYADITNEEIIAYAFTRRQQIEPVITAALQILFPEENITTPYRKSTESLDEVLLREYDPVHRAYQYLSWNSLEVAHFVKMDGGGLSNFYQRWGEKKKESKSKQIVPSEKLRKGHLTLRTASKIYELKDGRVAEKKIARQLHLHPEVVEYALQHRQEYEPEIVHGLQIMFPQEKIEKPYR